MRFPTPLTPLELYYWYDDRPEYPTVYPADLTFSGPLQREPLERAWRAVLHRHPMLTARIDATGKRPMWVTCDGEDAAIVWADDATPMPRMPTFGLDVSTGPGIRLWVRNESESSHLRILFHHASCDGLAALQVIGDLLVAYHQCCDGQRTLDLPALDPELLSSRGDFSELVSHLDRTVGLRVREVVTMFREWGKILGTHPAPIAATLSPPSHREMPLGYASRTIAPETIGGLRRTARAGGVGLNDVLMRDLFRTLDAWNRHATGESRRSLRINMPVNLRGRSDRNRSAANRLGFGFLTRASQHMADSEGLLRSIHAETEKIRRDFLGLFFLGGIEMAGSLPGLLPWFLHRNRCFATVVLSNLGRIFSRLPLPKENRRLVCGGVRLEHFTAVPPIRPCTHGAMGVFQYAGGMTLCLQGDDRVLGAGASESLLNRYVERLANTAIGELSAG